MKKLFILTVIALTFFTFGANSQIIVPVKWKYTVQKVKGSKDEVNLTAIGTIIKKWHLYGQYSEPAGGAPLKFTFDKSPGYKLIGKVQEWPKPHKEYDDIMRANIQTFEGKAYFTQKIKVLSSKDFVVSGQLEGQACSESCIQFKDKFKYNVKGIAKEVAEKDTTIEDTVDTTSTNKAVSSTIEKFDTTSNKKTNTATSDISEESLTDAEKAASKSLWILFWLAFGAGLLAILTPCVFPMIPMTVTFFLHDKDGKGKQKALFFGASIIFIYVVLGVLVSMIFGAGAGNIIATHWIPNLIFFIFFMIFAASFLGMFEIVLPNWLVNKSDEKADKGGFLAPFFMALTLSVVSFSCTGPIVASLLFGASTGGILYPIVGMFGFSLAFAIPFTLFAFFPQILQKMKSGSWLNSIKVVLGFAELALGLKFLSVIDLNYHLGILDRHIFLAIWIVIFTLVGFYLLGKLKLNHDSDLPHIKVPRLMLAIITFSFVVYMIPGMFGAPLKLLSGIIPPITTQNFDVDAIVRDNISVASFSGENNEKPQDYEARKYDLKSIPFGIKGFYDYEQGMAYAKKVGKPVFLDFTGHSCQNCRKMEESVWVKPEILKIMKNDYVLISLYVDDKSVVLKKEDWVVSKITGDTLKMLGEKYADMQIYKYKMNAQPLYVLLDNDGKKLTKQRNFNTDVPAFIEFLQAGLKEYKNRQSKK